MIGFAAVGYLMHRFDYSRVTFLIGFVIGPQFELSLRQSLIMTDGNPLALLAHPFAIAILAIALIGKRAGDALAILSPPVRRQRMKININADIGES